MSATGPRTGGTPVVDRRRRRTLSDEPTPTFFTSALDGAPRWVAGVLSALQAALLSFLVLTLPAVAAYVATSADPSNSGVGWFRSVGVGSAEKRITVQYRNSHRFDWTRGTGTRKT